jgi:uncharacterized membrane protein
VNTGRLEAFSDGVIAIIITIMVLELKAPHETDLAALAPLAPVFLSYVLSFVFLGIYWNNHHHMLHVAERVDGRGLWANLHLLFWLSLVPFVTAWMGENAFSAIPVALYGLVLMMAAIAYFILSRALLALHERDSVLTTAMGQDFKEKVSILIYLIGIALTFVNSWLGFGAYVLVAVMWFMPDPRIEREVLPESDP